MICFHHKSTLTIAAVLVLLHSIPTSCTSVKNVNVPSSYRVKISQIILPFEGEHHSYQIFIQDTVFSLYEVVNNYNERKQKLTRDTLYQGTFVFLGDDIPLIDSTINNLWKNLDTVYTSPRMDANETYIELVRDGKQKNIKIFGCGVRDVDILVDIISPYCKKAKIGCVSKTNENK